MTIQKQYLKYKKFGENFGLIASPNAKIQFVKINNDLSRHIAVAAGEDLLIWDIKTLVKYIIIKGEICHITTFTFLYQNEPLVAIGYTDGSIKIFNYEKNSLKCNFFGHRSSITALCFDSNGMKLASGAMDNDIVLWDIVNESGLFRLKGHKKLITNLCFMKKNSDILVSSSKDTLLKFWDLTTQHCFKTLFGHKNEIINFALFKDDKRLITGSNNLKIFKIIFNKEINEEEDEILEIDEYNMKESDEENENIIKEEEDNSLITVRYIGTILRASKTKLINLDIDEKNQLFVCNGSDFFVECFKIRNKKEIKLHFEKRVKKLKRKLKENNNIELVSNVDHELEKITFKDEFQRIHPIKTNLIVKSCSVINFKDNFKISVLSNENSFLVYNYSLTEELNFLMSFNDFGHKSFIKNLSISKDNYFVASISKESLKIWNLKSKNCINTIDILEQGTCCTFTSGNRFCIIGTNKGSLKIFNIGSSEEIKSIIASKNQMSITCICPFPNDKGLVTGSEDKCVKFWNYDLIKQNNQNYLSLNLNNVLNMDEEIKCIKLSKDMKFLAISLLDSTVKIYYLDSLKFFLSLYGHKFPVTCMDISSDCLLIATGSSDKNIKIWNLDFGDCQKSIFAHDGTITDLIFVPNSHYFFTCSIDKTIKQWDADTFEKIITLRGHEAEINSLAITSDGNYLISSGKDLSLRVWQKTKEILVIQDELDTEREEQIIKEEFYNDETVIPGEINLEIGLASKKNMETLRSTEKLIEAIDIYENELLKIKEYNLACELSHKNKTDKPLEPVPNILFSIYKTNCPNRYILEVLKSIKSSEIEECLIFLPFSYVTQLLSILTNLLENNWEIELICRFASFLTRLNFGQIVSNRKLIPIIEKLKNISLNKVLKLKNLTGSNLAALDFFGNQLISENEISLFTQKYSDLKDKKRKKTKKLQTDSPAFVIGIK